MELRHHIPSRSNQRQFQRLPICRQPSFLTRRAGDRDTFAGNSDATNCQPSTHTSSDGDTINPPATRRHPQYLGQVVLVSITQQWLWAYQNKQLVYNTLVTTGRPELPTPDGIYPMQYKTANITFISPWPIGSPYYYSPEHVDYALYFLYDGYYVHDAPWRTDFGPGTELPHTGPGGAQETGSHGCVEVPVSAGAWLYSWAQNGLTVDIIGTTPAPVATPTSPPAPATATPFPTPTPTKVPPTVASSPTPTH